MPVGADDIKVGHCYAAADGRQVKVTALVDGRVHYETWAGNVPTDADDTPALDAFRQGLDREIPCPEADHSVPSQAEGEREPGDAGMDRPVPSQAEGE